jgi:hypothetical protein
VQLRKAAAHPEPERGEFNQCQHDQRRRHLKLRRDDLLPQAGGKVQRLQRRPDQCAMVVARRVNFEGNTNIQNNTTGCVANSKVKGKVIKLIA